MEMDFRELASGLLFPEGPVILADGSVVLVEIGRGTVTKVAPDGAVTYLSRQGGGPNGLALGPDGKLYICNNGGFKWTPPGDARGLLPIGQADDYSGGRIERLDLVTGELEVLYRASEACPFRGPNDIVFDDQGGFYFTDLGKARPRELDRGGVYYAKADGSFITEMVHPMVTPNGIGLSPDGTVLYVAETETARLWAFDLEGPGEFRRQPFPSPHGGRIVAGIGGYNRFDSLAVDADGNVCVATLVNGGITVIEPDTGDWRHIPVPGERWVTNIAFGGPELRTAYITLSSTGRLVSTEWENSGLLLNYQQA
jgi:gluconolactonase